jgi:hypothetical protein
MPTRDNDQLGALLPAALLPAALRPDGFDGPGACRAAVPELSVTFV